MRKTTEHLIIDQRWPYLLDARTRQPTLLRLRHPRRTTKYSFAMILQDWARQKWTPDVVIKRF